jgi:hypothetical protein
VAVTLIFVTPAGTVQVCADVTVAELLVKETVAALDAGAKIIPAGNMAATSAPEIRILRKVTL